MKWPADDRGTFRPRAIWRWTDHPCPDQLPALSWTLIPGRSLSARANGCFTDTKAGFGRVLTGGRCRRGVCLEDIDLKLLARRPVISTTGHGYTSRQSVGVPNHVPRPRLLLLVLIAPPPGRKDREARPTALGPSLKAYMANHLPASRSSAYAANEHLRHAYTANQITMWTIYGS